MNKTVEKFLKYVSYETTSYEPKEEEASSVGQYVLAKELKKELEELGINNVTINKFGTVVCDVPGTIKGPKIALIAHMDTSNSASGKDVKAKIVKYEGGKIELSPNIYLDPKDFPTLLTKVGHELIVTDGTTLLGGDDKAGIAIIMTVLEDLISSKTDHLPLEVIFTSDEEIGCGADHVLDEEIRADYAYTIDGGSSHSVNVENFNAGSLKVVVNGRSIHPGDAKDKMINAINVAIDFQNSLPTYERPEHTQGREGFYHLMHIGGNEEKCEMQYIVRDHDLAKLLHRFEIARLSAQRINDKYNSKVIEIIENENSYRNMKTILDEKPEAVERVTKVYEKKGISFSFDPIRGGTDGASLTYRGLPCPNLGTGDYNCHGRFEYVDIDEMIEMVDIVKGIVTE